jgi:serine/threonine-protein kinase
VAYVSDESGRPEVYVRPFSGPGTRHQVSTDGGVTPAWARNGRELFFAKDDTLFTAPVTVGVTFTNGSARRLMSGPFDFGGVRRNYDVSPDGRYFVAPRSPLEAAPRRIELVLNWFEELRRLAR